MYDADHDTGFQKRNKKFPMCVQHLGKYEWLYKMYFILNLRGFAEFEHWEIEYGEKVISNRKKMNKE